MYTLVVVDMQPQFRSSQNQTTKKSVNNLLKKAVKDKAAIIFLEFGGYDRTDSELMATVQGYKRAFYRTKHENDGSDEVLETIQKQALPRRKLKVCGVNTNYCVRETVEGLIDKFNDKSGIGKVIEVDSKAVNCAFYHESGLDKLREMQNVKVID